MEKPQINRLMHISRPALAARLGMSLILACAASTADAQNPDFRVVGLQQLVPSPYGGRAGWSPGPNNLIAYDSINTTTGFYDVWTMNPDGSNRICLTCNWEPPPANGAASNPQPNYNKGNPDWDPTGQYIVFEVQRNDTTYTAAQDTNARPGVGEDLVLYIMDAAGKNFWPIAASANYTPHDGGVLHPKFSHGTSSRGVMITWAQEVANGTGANANYNGVWDLKVASFTTVLSAPVVSLLYVVSPGGSVQCQGPFYETHGFSLDDSIIFYSGNPQAGCSGVMYGYDEYTYDLNTQAYTDITNTPEFWEEHARPHPLQKKLLYVSSYGLSQSGNLIEEYWTMNYDGSDKKKITWVTDPRGQSFNTTIPNFYIPGNTSAGRSDWSHDGLQAVVYFTDTNASGQSTFGATGSLWLLTLEPSSTTQSTASYANYPQSPNSIPVSFGSDLATEQFQATTIPLGTNLGGTTVSVLDSQGVSRPADLFFVDPQQVNWLIPAQTALGPALVTTTSGDGAQSTDFFDVESVGPGLYGVNSSGSGPAAAYLQPGNQSTSICPTASTCTTVPVNVSSGQTYLILFGTGLQYHQSPATVDFTNQAGTVLASLTASFAGAQGTEAGLNQINVLLPVSLAGSGLLNVTVTVDSRTSNAVQVAIQ